MPDWIEVSLTRDGEGVEAAADVLRRYGTHIGFGDLQVLVEVQVPTCLNKDQKLLFQQLGAALDDAIILPANDNGFFQRVIDWLRG